ncbi:MAG: hypothetical protein ACLTER_18565 [Ruminococcus sp.]
MWVKVDAGKSTVARMIAGIIPVSGGEVLLEGEAYMNLKGSEKDVSAETFRWFSRIL